MYFIRKINVKVAASVMLVMLSCVTVFHLMVLAGVVSYGMVWGGRLESVNQMYVFETVALSINIVIMCVVAIKVGFIKPWIPDKAVTFILWLLVAFFVLNTVVNLFADNKLEAILFAPLTLISALIFYRLAIEE